MITEGTQPEYSQYTGVHASLAGTQHTRRQTYLAIDLTLREVHAKIFRYYHSDLPGWVSDVIERNNTEMDIRESDPGAVTEYRSACWHFVGEVRGHPLFAGDSVYDAIDKLDGTFNWSSLPSCDIYLNEMDPEDAFIDAWGYQEEHGIPPLAFALPPVCAVQYADQFPVRHRRDEGKYARTLTLLFWYSRLLGRNDWFFLSTHTIAELLECSAATASLHMRRARREGLIQLLQEHPRASRKANEYRWTGEVQFLAETQ